MPDSEHHDPNLFGVLATRHKSAAPLILTGLSFSRVINEIVFPFELGNMFIIDGAPLRREQIDRIKILKLRKSFGARFADFHWSMRQGELKVRELYGNQYSIRLEAVFRECTDDVTMPMFNAFQAIIRPVLTDYPTQREALVRGAEQYFLESLFVFSGLKMREA